MTHELLKTPLHAWHCQHGGRMVEFGGWSMPVQYTGIVEEHVAVRTKGGLFDISHMARLSFAGPQAEAFLNRLVTVDVTKLTVGQIKYALVCRNDGGILDDVLVYRRPQEWGLVVNASNRLKILAWIDAQRAGFDFTLHDRTVETTMIAAQGPATVELAARLIDPAIRDLKYYRGGAFYWQGHPVEVSRTGYTGEDGVEVVVAAEHGTALWDAFLTAGAAEGVVPCGLGARDTLRLEAGMPLYGHELSEELTPYDAGLWSSVSKTKADYLGCEALRAQAPQPLARIRVGLELPGRRIAREGSRVLYFGGEQGVVTSGTFSPTLQKSIAMAYVNTDIVEPNNTALEVDIRGKTERAAIVPLPFYQRKR